MAGTDPRLGLRFWGVNCEKGACTSPLFYFLLAISLLSAPPVLKTRAKKVSGRSGGSSRSGVGDGGYCNPKLVFFFRTFHCAREQQNDTQEQTSYDHFLTPEAENQFPTTVKSLRSTLVSVDSPPDSFRAVLRASLGSLELVPWYFRIWRPNLPDLAWKTIWRGLAWILARTVLF